MRRRRRRQMDEAQSSLDRFTQGGEAERPAPAEPHVPPMPDLDVLEAAEAKIDGNAHVIQSERVPQEDGPRSFQMPSEHRHQVTPLPSTSVTYHDMGVLYPYAPVPLFEGEMVLHNATLVDITGCGP